MISIDQLQAALRKFEGPLINVEVRHESTATALLMPHKAIVNGVCHLHGKPLVFEVELDLRTITSGEHVMAFAGKLLTAFQEAEKRAA